MESSRMYLPFDPDDEWTDCLKVALVGDKIAFNFVRVAEGGWGVFDYDLEGFITSPHKIVDEGPNLVNTAKRKLFPHC
jgi:hypothetical protein